MDINLAIRYLNNLWRFVLDNPEISIAIAGAVGTSTVWLFRFCARWWKRKNPPIVPPIIAPPLFIPHVTPPPLASAKSEVWFINVGEHRGHLMWEDCVQYGCIGAGGGATYRDALQKLNPGDTVYAYITGEGYVGYGQVLEKAVPVKDFIVAKTSLLKNELKTEGLERCKDNLELSEYVVRINWLKTYPRDRARWRSGLFVYSATLCRLTETKTLNFLSAEFRPKAGDNARRYSNLDYYLSKQDWKAADKETYQLLISEFNKKGTQYLSPEELISFPLEPLKTIDNLWVKHSEGKFGLSVQKKIYTACGGVSDYYHHEEAWSRFCEDVGWTIDGKNECLDYSDWSPTGYLPSFSCSDETPAQDFPYENIASHPGPQPVGMITEILFSRLGSICGENE